MLQNLINQSKFKFFIYGLIPLIFVILLIWPPLLWHKEVEFSKPLFATEYYKFFLDIAKVLFTFWLANIFILRLRRKEFLIKLERDWAKEKQNLIDVIQIFEKIPDCIDDDIDLKALIKKLEKIDGKISYLAENSLSHTSKEDLDHLGILLFEYRDKYHDQVEKLILSMKNGNTTILRKLDEEIVEAISSLKNGLLEV